MSYLIRQSGQVQYANQNWTTSIQGVTSNYPPMTNWQIADGRDISAEDDSQAALVAVIGQTVYVSSSARTRIPIGAVDPGQGRAVARRRNSRGQGTDAFRHRIRTTWS